MNNRLTARDKDHILLLFKAGNNLTEIAGITRRSLDSVRAVLRKAGVAAGEPGRPSQRIVVDGPSGSFWGGDE